MAKFKLVSKYTPSVDQKRAIEKLVEGIKKDKRHQKRSGNGFSETQSLPDEHI